MQTYNEIIQEILLKEPTLTSTGVNSKVGYADDPIPEDGFLFCLEFLDKKTVPLKYINRKAGSSYMLKHDVEKYVEETYGHHYISNGALIAALLYRGIKIRTYRKDDYPNVHAAIKLKKEKKGNEPLTLDDSGYFR